MSPSLYVKTPLALLLLSLAAIGSGCTEDNPLGRMSVVGEIKLDGTPLAQGTIEFSPTGTGTSSGASIDAGKFSIPAEKGLPPGEYIVRISAADADAEPIEVPGESSKLAPELIPAEYNADSTQRFTVTTDKENRFDLDIKSTAGQNP